MLQLGSTLPEIEALAARRKEEIRNTLDRLQTRGATYYVSAEGNDDSDGKTPESAWKTPQKASLAPLREGDAVLFRRGDVFRGAVQTASGVTYAAYGEGDKPRFYSWHQNLGCEALWSLVDAEHHIWRLNDPILDVGTLVFDEGERHARKRIPSYRNGCFVCREDESRPFVMQDAMTQDLDLYWHFDTILTTKPSKGEDFPIPDVAAKDALGTLYLRCDAGNPGSVFSSIEALARCNLFHVGSNANVHIDNLCIKYVGCHAIAAGGVCVRGLHVTNCEIGWIGGCIQHYFGTDPNYPQGKRGTVTRYGNGVEIYGGCEDYEVSNCYIYQIYDAGITHQVTVGTTPRVMKTIRYENNLIEDCVYSIEYFLEKPSEECESYMEDVEITGNLLRRSGYGWGQQRHNVDTPAHIKGWSYVNTAKEFSICNNLFDRAAYRMLHLVAEQPESCPRLEGNTYVQALGGCLGQYGANRTQEPPILPFNGQAEATVRQVFGDASATVVIL